MTRGETENYPGGQDHYHGQYHHSPSRMSHHPIIASIDHLEVSFLISAFHIDDIEVDLMTDYLHEDDIDQRHNEEHVDGFVAYLPVASDIVTDQVAGAPKELQQRVGKGAGVYSPYVEDVFTDPFPCDVSVAGSLRADGAVVALEHMAAVGAQVFLQRFVGVAGRLAIGRKELFQSVFKRHVSVFF